MGERAALLAVPLLLAGCTGPLSALDPAGPAASDIARLWWAMLAGAGGLTAMVLALVWAGFRPPAARQPSERFWTHGLGIGFSLIVLAAVVGAGIRIGERLQARGAAAVTVHAEARQWAWSFRQPGPGGDEIATTGTLYIPAGRPVDVLVSAEDVIHSFWVPQLGGKMDAIPGRVNRLRLEADAPGRFGGICAEFCGLGHAGMRFEVVAYDAEAPPIFTDLGTDLDPEAAE